MINGPYLNQVANYLLDLGGTNMNTKVRTAWTTCILNWTSSTISFMPLSTKGLISELNLRKNHTKQMLKCCEKMFMINWISTVLTKSLNSSSLDPN